MNSVRYLCQVFPAVEFKHAPVKRRGLLQLLPGQRADGYGSKISTDRTARIGGKGPWLRVYCVIHSNVGSLYVLKNGEKLFIRDMDIPA